MAATGYTPISLYYSTTASAVPTAGNLANGELALNIADMKLYAKNGSGVVTLLASNAATTPTTPGGSTTQVQYNSSGSFAGSANMTFDGTTLTVADFADSSLTSGRVVFPGAGGNLTGSANLFWDSANNRLGIGTASPQAKLHVYGSAALFDGLTGTSGSSGYGIHLTNSSSASYKWQLGMDSATSSLQFYDSGGNGIVMTLTRPGNLGLGTTSPTYKLHVSSTSYGSTAGFFRDRDVTVFGQSSQLIEVGALNGTTATPGAAIGGVLDNPATTGSMQFLTRTASALTTKMTLSSAGGLSVGTTADPGAGAIYATGAITAYYSDDRLKTRLGLIENALDKVDQLQGFYYEANETAQALGYKVKREVGVSAQSVQAVLPEIVSPAPIDQQYLTVDYERLVPLLIEAVKELRAEVKVLKGTI